MKGGGGAAPSTCPLRGDRDAWGPAGLLLGEWGRPGTAAANGNGGVPSGSGANGLRPARGRDRRGLCGGSGGPRQERGRRQAGAGGL